MDSTRRLAVPCLGTATARLSGRCEITVALLHLLAVPGVLSSSARLTTPTSKRPATGQIFCHRLGGTSRSFAANSMLVRTLNFWQIRKRCASTVLLLMFK